MWDWLMEELQKATKALHTKKELVDVDNDDIIQNILLMLLDNQELAQDIYAKRNVGVLYTIVRRELYAEEAVALYFDNKMDLSRFQRIIEACEEYNIEPKSQNAYKVAALLGDDHNNFTITTVTRLLSTYEKFAEHKLRRHIAQRLKQQDFADDLNKVNDE